MEQTAAGFAPRVDIGTIAIACGLGYLDFRFPDLGWRESGRSSRHGSPRFAARPSMAATVPHG